MNAKNEPKSRVEENIRLQLSAVLDPQSLAVLKQLVRDAVAEVLELPPPPAESAHERRLHASQGALFGGKDRPEDIGLLIDTRTAAKMLNVSLSTVYAMHYSGKMPNVVRIGRAIRWRHAELIEWVNAGCPPCIDGKFRPASSGNAK